MTTTERERDLLSQSELFRATLGLPMGTYVEFRPCEAEGPMQQLLDRLPHFAEWYTTDFNEEGDPEVEAAIHALRDSGTAAFESEPFAPQVFDKLTLEFYGFYCDAYRARPVLPPVLRVGALRVQRYRQLLNEMSELIEPRVAQLWSFILDGRTWGPPNRTTPFQSDDAASWISWWSLTEIHELLRGLPSSAFSRSEFTRDVLRTVHEALSIARRDQHGLVVTAF